MASHNRMTQDKRLRMVENALWFSAKYYTPEAENLLATINVTEAAISVIAMLDSMEMIAKLPERDTT